MPKVQDLFKRADGSKILDTKLYMKIVDIPSESVEKQTQKGGTIHVFPVKLEHQGNQYEWDLSGDQLSRIFTKTDKAGAVFWQAKNGDAINVWYASNLKNPTRPYYNAEKADGPAPVATEGVAAAEDVFNLPSTPPAPAKPKFAPTKYSGAAKTEWDGSPRQSSFRQGYAGMIQAILCNPAINPRNAEDISFTLDLARKMVEEVRVQSKVLEASIKD